MWWIVAVVVLVAGLATMGVLRRRKGGETVRSNRTFYRASIDLDRDVHMKGRGPR